MPWSVRWNVIRCWWSGCERLRTVPGVGPITALTWALEIGDVSRFRSIKQAISYCGLCGAEKSSADKVHAHAASPNSATSTFSMCWWKPPSSRPGQCHELALIYETERQRGNRNRATLAVARKIVAYMLAVERRQQDFVPTEKFGAHRGSVKTFPNNGKSITGLFDAQAARSRRLADWAKEIKLRRLTTNCFGTGREHKLNLLRRLCGA